MQDESNEVERHHIFEDLGVDQILKMQVRNLRNEKVLDFSPGARLADIRAELYKAQGAGPYSLAALRAKPPIGRPIGSFQSIEVTERDSPQAKTTLDLPPASAPGMPGVDLTEVFRVQGEILAEAREAARQVAQDAQEERDSIVRAANLRAERLIDEAREDVARMIAQAQRVCDDAEAQLARAEQKERDNREWLESHRLDLAERMARIEREASEYKSRVEMDALKREFELKLSKATDDGIPKSVKGQMFTRMLDRHPAFKEPNPIEKLIEEYGPLIEAVAEKFGAFNAQVQGAQGPPQQGPAELTREFDSEGGDLPLDEALDRIAALHAQEAGDEEHLEHETH